MPAASLPCHVKVILCKQFVKTSVIWITVEGDKDLQELREISSFLRSLCPGTAKRIIRPSMTLISLCLPPRLLSCSHAAHTPALRLFAVSRLSRALAPLPGTLPLPDISLRPPARRRPLLFPLHAVAVASTAPVRFWPVLVQAYAADPIGALLAVGACLAAAALAALTVAAIPTILVR
jgi:hypothetical protein